MKTWQGRSAVIHPASVNRESKPTAHGISAKVATTSHTKPWSNSSMAIVSSGTRNGHTTHLDVQIAKETTLFLATAQEANQHDG
jgi:hypothetical protein